MVRYRISLCHLFRWHYYAGTPRRDTRCYIGGVESDGKTPKDTRTQEQKSSLKAMLLELKSVYCDAIVHSHRDFSSKACPSFDATTEYEWISKHYDVEEEI